MRILYFHRHFSGLDGDAGIQSYQMARIAVSHGHQVTPVCGSYRNNIVSLESLFKCGHRRGVIDRIDVVELDLNFANIGGLLIRATAFMRYASRSIGVARRENYGLGFATAAPSTVRLPGTVALWVRRKNSVLKIRDLWPELPKRTEVIKNLVVLAMLLALEWAANCCVALSLGIAEGIVGCGVKPDKVAMVPNGYNIQICQSAAQDAWQPGAAQ